MERLITIGAVAYDPRAVTIWEGMRDYFRAAGPPIDYILYSNYDRQVQALLARHIDIAWNTNLAWVKAQWLTNGTCRVLAMRDVDARFTTVFAARVDSGIHTLADIKGKRLALGSADSAQAAILPVHYLQQAGVEPGRDCAVTRFDVDVGKHGDTGTSELDALQALARGTADAAALGETTWAAQLAKGKIDPAQVRAVWRSPGYCHCNFTVLADFPEDLGRRWVAALLQMSRADPRWRTVMDLEGLQRWLPADPAVLAGYRVLFEAVEQQGLARHWQTGAAE